MHSKQETTDFAEAVLSASGSGEGPEFALVAADFFLEHGDLPLAASALDRAFGLCPEDDMLDRRRQVLLDQLAVVEHGIRFCYVPAGTFLMGSNDGDPDEQPVHAVRLGEYWMSETPVTWAAYCDLMGWSPPPEGYPREELTNPGASFAAREENKIRLQYCESETKRARDWHAHAVDQRRQTGGRTEPDQLFGPVEREDPSRPYRYDEKPMVAVAWQDALAMCERISTETVRYTLPSEAQWEKAARGGRIGQPYPWGFDEPDPSRCDFGHFGEFAVRPPRTLPSNGHGLFGMSGGVWEWTADVYDSLAYAGNTPPRQSDENLPRRCAAALGPIAPRR